MLRIKNYILKDKNIKKELTILNMSDVHSDIKKLEEVINYANRLKPDIITVAGDLLDDIFNENNEKIFKLLAATAESIPVFVGLGNHDLLIFDKMGFYPRKHFSNDYRQFVNAKETTKIKVLMDNTEIYHAKGINILGFNPPFEWYEKDIEDPEKFKTMLNDYLKKFNLKEDEFNLLLVHSCNGIIKDKKILFPIPNVNLIFSGHNHGGITPQFVQRISKNNRGLIGPYTRWFMKDAYGFWTDKNTSVILSNGVTKMGKSHGPKWLCKALNALLKIDIEIVRLVPGEEHSLNLEKIDRT